MQEIFRFVLLTMCVLLVLILTPQAPAQWSTDPSINNPISVQTTGQHLYLPTITGDDSGGAIITWYRVGTTPDVYAQRIDVNGVVRWAANGIAISTEAHDQINPTIVNDGAGGAVITWEDFRNGANFDIYAQRVNASGAVQWAANGVGIATGGRSRASSHRR